MRIWEFLCLDLPLEVFRVVFSQHCMSPLMLLEKCHERVDPLLQGPLHHWFWDSGDLSGVSPAFAHDSWDGLQLTRVTLSAGATWYRRWTDGLAVLRRIQTKQTEFEEDANGLLGVCKTLSALAPVVVTSSRYLWGILTRPADSSPSPSFGQTIFDFTQFITTT